MISVVVACFLNSLVVVCVCRPAFCDWRLRPGLSSVSAGRCSATMTTSTGIVVCVWRPAFCEYDDYDWYCRLCLAAGVLWLWRLRPGLSSVLPAGVLWVWRLRPRLSSVFAIRRSVSMTTTTGTVVCLAGRRSVTMTTTTVTIVCVCWPAFCDYVEFYLYPTVGTILIHSVKPELTE